MYDYFRTTSNTSEKKKQQQKKKKKQWSNLRKARKLVLYFYSLSKIDFFFFCLIKIFDVIPR